MANVLKPVGRQESHEPEMPAREIPAPDLAAQKAAKPDFAIARVHFFPLGGISQTAAFTSQFATARPAARAASA